MAFRRSMNMIGIWGHLLLGAVKVFKVFSKISLYPTEVLFNKWVLQGEWHLYSRVHFESRDRAWERHKTQPQKPRQEAAAFQRGSRKPFQIPGVGKKMCFNGKLDLFIAHPSPWSDSDGMETILPCVTCNRGQCKTILVYRHANEFFQVERDPSPLWKTNFASICIHLNIPFLFLFYSISYSFLVITSAWFSHYE